MQSRILCREQYSQQHIGRSPILSKYCQRNAKSRESWFFCDFFCLIISPLYDTLSRVPLCFFQEDIFDHCVFDKKHKNSREQVWSKGFSKLTSLHVSSLIANSMIQLRFVITFSAIALTPLLDDGEGWRQNMNEFWMMIFLVKVAWNLHWHDFGKTSRMIISSWLVVSMCKKIIASKFIFRIGHTFSIS